MLLFIDNFDSFTYNLVQVFQKLEVEVKVVRNTITLQECFDLKPSHIVVGPGPGAPSEAGVSKLLIQHNKTIPLLGVCLGHQALGEVFGAKVKRAKRPMHGMLSSIYHSGVGVFEGLPSPFEATRYHSLIVDELPACLEVTARTHDGEIMGIRHNTLPLEGVQFHPESILTEKGERLLENFFLRDPIFLS